MSDEITVKNSRLRLAKVDITDFEIDAFVFYAQHDLALGSGFGTAISQRGGPKIQEELNDLAPLKTTEVAISDAGEMKSKHIIHAVGPRFQEPDLESKLETTIQNCLKQADGKGIKAVAFPPMGAGFYGVPLDVSARITLETIQTYLANSTSIEEVVVCLGDNREYKPFQSHLATMNKG